VGFDVDRALRRLRPGRRRRSLARRDISLLPFVSIRTPPSRNLLLDTSVYVHAGQGKLPGAVAGFIESSRIHHSSVCYLDPLDPRSAGNTAFIADTLRRIPAHRTVGPDAEIFVEAGILSGTLARLQGIATTASRKLLNDALTLLTARKHGLVVLTADIADFDLLSQLRPDCRVLFYSAV
jgi:predicted nucleic acid-binding protein